MHKVTVVLSDEEFKFLKAMAKWEGENSYRDEVQSLVSCELWHWMELYKDELVQGGYLKEDN